MYSLLPFVTCNMVEIVLISCVLTRFEKKRIVEELEVVKRKASRLKSKIEGSSVVEKLQQEVREYREILKCGICLDRRKEVNIHF